MSKRVVITGAGGLIGGILLGGLSGDWELDGVDAKKKKGLGRADMTKLSAAERSFAGAEAVVDLAASPSPSISWDEAYRNNMSATMNQLEAARCAGVKRIVYASSNHVTGMYEQDEPYASIVSGEYDGLDPTKTPLIAAGSAPRPDGPYAVSKAFGESAGRYYAEAHGISVICLRIGTVNPEGRPSTPREFATLLSHHDLVHLVHCCLSASDEIRFAVFYGVSDNTWRFWEIADATEAIGYSPRDNAESWRPQEAPTQ